MYDFWNLIFTLQRYFWGYCFDPFLAGILYYTSAYNKINNVVFPDVKRA